VEKLDEILGGELDPVPILVLFRRGAKYADGKIYGLFPRGKDG
jgi:hypothetical protein